MRVKLDNGTVVIVSKEKAEQLLKSKSTPKKETATSKKAETARKAIKK